MVEVLQLPWLNIMPYPHGKFGGWVAENYLALSQLCLWFYSSIDEVSEDEVHTLPNSQQSEWLKKDNVYWLKIRGLLIEGNAVSLKNQ